MNSFSTYIIINNYTFSSSLRMCSLLCTSFSFVILCSFSIALSTLMLLWTQEFQKCSQPPTTNENRFWWLLSFFFFEHLAHHIHFFTYPLLLINTWSLQLIRPITTSLRVLYITTCKHFASSLKINTLDSIFWLVHIPSIPTLIVPIPPCSSCMPFANYVQLFVDCVNSFADYDNTSIDYTNKSDDCVNTPDDLANTFVDSTNTFNISSSNLWIPIFSLL